MKSFSDVHYIHLEGKVFTSLETSEVGVTANNLVNTAKQILKRIIANPIEVSKGDQEMLFNSRQKTQHRSTGYVTKMQTFIFESLPGMRWKSEYIHDWSVDSSSLSWRRAVVNKKTWWAGSLHHTTASGPIDVSSGWKTPRFALPIYKCTKTWSKYLTTADASLTNKKPCRHYFASSFPWRPSPRRYFLSEMTWNLVVDYKNITQKIHTNTYTRQHLSESASL